MEGKVRTGGGLKGSERLDKSNPLKVRPTLCLPMRLRIPRLRVPDSPERSVPRSSKRKADTAGQKRDARTHAKRCAVKTNDKSNKSAFRTIIIQL